MMKLINAKNNLIPLNLTDIWIQAKIKVLRNLYKSKSNQKDIGQAV